MTGRSQPDALPRHAKSVDIITVNWNSGRQLQDCLRSIDAFGGPEVNSVIVIDNGSVDGSAAVSLEKYPLDLVMTGENLGFGRACNLAAARSTADYLLFLNPDAELLEGVVQRALDSATSPEIGVVGVRLIDRDGVTHRHCARYPSWRSFIGNSLGLTRIARRWFPPMLMFDFDHETTRQVDHVMGAFYLMPRALFEEVDGFDDTFFVYLEDLDLSRRVTGKGRKVIYLADTAAYHRQGGTSESVKAHRLYYSLQSNILYAFKHLSPIEAWTVALVTLVIEPFSRTVRGVFRLSRDEVWFTWQGFGMFYRALPRIMTDAFRLRRERGAHLR